jgi:hypothetical protein
MMAEVLSSTWTVEGAFHLKSPADDTNGFAKFRRPDRGLAYDSATLRAGLVQLYRLQSSILRVYRQSRVSFKTIDPTNMRFPQFNLRPCRWFSKMNG